MTSVSDALAALSLVPPAPRGRPLPAQPVPVVSMQRTVLRRFIGLRRAEEPDQEQAKIEAQDQEHSNDQRVFHARILPTSIVRCLRRGRH